MGSPESQGVGDQTLMKVGHEQTQILNIILRGNEDGSHVDKFQILDRVDYTNTLNNVWFLIRYMLVQGRIARDGKIRRVVKENGRNLARQTYKITEFGKSLITVNMPQSETSDYKHPVL